MAFVVTCSSCKARLKTPDLVAAGTLVACPKCSKNFTLKEDSPELIENESVPSKPRKKTKIVEDLADDKDVFDDAKPSKPKSKNRRDEEDDEDDRPRSKKKRASEEDDEVDRPKSRKRRDDDEEDDEEDDLPTARTKSRKKKKSPLLLILAISLPLLFLICGGAGYGIYSLFYSGGPSKDMLVWAPTGSVAINGIKYSKTSTFPALRLQSELEVSRLKSLGLRVDDIDEIMTAKQPTSTLQVVRTKSAIDEGLLMKSSFGTELTIAGKKCYKGMFGCFHVPSSKILVLCYTEKELTEILMKESKVTISADLKEMLDKTSGDIWQARTNPNTQLLPGVSNANVKGECTSIRLSETQIKLTHHWVFSSEDGAKNAENALKTMAELMKAGTVPGKKLETYEISRNGTTLTFTAQGPIDNSSLFNSL